jgi:DNA-binding NtrC family response regulator
MPPTLLAIDDEPGVLALLERCATELGFNVISAGSGRGGLERIARDRPDVALVDVQMPDVNGLDVLRAIREIDPVCSVVLTTGKAGVHTAIEAVRLGALDYLTKPLDMDRLRELLTTAQKSVERRQTLLNFDADVARRFEFHGMIGRSAPMQEIFDAIRRLAEHARTILITGETGTGKELVARAFHRMGPRRNKRLLTVNCSALVPALFESELFGHQRGAFTGAAETKSGVFEHADGATLFLDEIGELPPNVQPKLLRAVENGEVQRVGGVNPRRVDVRVIAATNRDLRAASSAGRFRPDLFYRLGVVQLHLPPLRERREDIPLLIAAFLRDCARRTNRPVVGITTEAERVLLRAPWDGNVRELRNVLERACMLSEARMLTEREILSSMWSGSVLPGTAPQPGGEPRQPPAAETRADDLLATVQRAQIDRVLTRVGGNKSEAARILGISRRSLYRWIDRFERGDASRPSKGKAACERRRAAR